MFSYTINNPSKFVINKDNFYAIPFGHRCTSAISCKYARIRKFSLPFDWTIPLFPNKIQKVLDNKFNDFIPDVYNNIFTNKYDIKLSHFNTNIDDGIEEYKRRIKRFNYIITDTSKKKYFVYINEDYLFDKKYREDKFNDNIFNQMLELENFLKKKYINIDYNILYFNFKHHNIPVNSNIINIVLHSTILHNTISGSPFEKFREYCGKILAEIFNTTVEQFNVKYDFNN